MHYYLPISLTAPVYTKSLLKVVWSLRRPFNNKRQTHSSQPSANAGLDPMVKPPLQKRQETMDAHRDGLPNPTLHRRRLSHRLRDPLHLVPVRPHGHLQRQLPIPFNLAPNLPYQQPPLPSPVQTHHLRIPAHNAIVDGLNSP